MNRVFSGKSLILLALALAASSPLPAGATDFPPANAYRQHDRLPPTCRRVAVLPLAVTAAEPEAPDGADVLEPALHAQLGKCGLFELVCISTADVKRWTGKPAWTAEEPLPRDLLDHVRKLSGCDAVLFPRLSSYHPYPPLRLGWNLKLVEVATRQVIWAVDETYDAGQPAVARQAKKFYKRQACTGQPLRDPRTILASPRLFGEFAASAALATLPRR
jgi:hypothetical protein